MRAVGEGKVSPRRAATSAMVQVTEHGSCRLGGLAKPDWALANIEHDGVVWRMCRWLFLAENGYFGGLFSSVFFLANFHNATDFIPEPTGNFWHDLGCFGGWIGQQ